MDLDPAALRRARVAAGLTQQQVASAVLNGDAGRVSQWERGTSQPFPRHLAGLAKVLGVAISDLLLPCDRKDLRRLRIERGLTIGELAEEVHLTEPTLRRWESGRVSGVESRLPVALATSLGITEEELLAALIVSRDRNS